MVKLKIKHKLAVVLLMASIISMSVTSALGYFIAKKTARQQTFDKLISIRNSKAQEISDYFHRLQDLTLIIVNSRTTISAFEAFRDAHSEIGRKNSIRNDQLIRMRSFRDNFFFNQYSDTIGPLAIERDKFLSYLPANNEAIVLQAACNNSDFEELDCFAAYRDALTRFDAALSDFVSYSDFGGLVLIDSETGDIVYTVNKSTDLGGNLLTDSLAHTNLAEAFRELRYAKEPRIIMVRFQKYSAADLLPKAFMVCPVFSENKNIAVAALRIPIDQLSNILTFGQRWSENGMGETGEIYLVGENSRMRSNSRFFIEDPEGFIATLGALGYSVDDLESVRKEGSTLLNIRIETEAVSRAISGETGIRIVTDYRNREVLCSYMPLDILGLRYAVVAQIDTAEAFSGIATLERFMLYSFLAVLISMVIIAFLISNIFTRPLDKLTETARELSNGNFQSLIEIKSGDEIGILADTFHTMQGRIVELIGNLRTVNSSLKDKQEEIYKSIRYARNIQNNILADHSLLRENLPQHFIFFSPRDVVSGDFYWAINVPSRSAIQNDGDYMFETRQGESFYLAVCDSTGHGIPGAFMSLLNVSFLNEAIVIKDIELPSDILNDVRESLISALPSEESKDGMDGVLIYIDPSKNQLHYSGGYNAPVLVRDNSLIRCEIDKMPIGKGPHPEAFTDRVLEIRKGDILYLYSDGFPDQFGGPQQRKYLDKRFREFLLSISSNPFPDQKELLVSEFERWRGSNEQTDDVLVVGIRF